MSHALSHKIPPEIDEIYYPLFNQVSHLHVQWNLFRQLYVSGPETVELLRWSVNGFFGVVQHTLASEILLTISRLTDAKQTGSGKRVRDNLSLDRLIDRIDQQQFPQLKDETSKRLIAAVKLALSLAMFETNSWLTAISQQILAIALLWLLRLRQQTLARHFDLLHTL